MPGHMGFLVNQDPQVLLLRAALNVFSTQPVSVLGVALTHVQDLALGLVELHEVQIGPSLKPVKSISKATGCIHGMKILEGVLNTTTQLLIQEILELQTHKNWENILKL